MCEKNRNELVRCWTVLEDSVEVVQVTENKRKKGSGGARTRWCCEITRANTRLFHDKIITVVVGAKVSPSAQQRTLG